MCYNKEVSLAIALFGIFCSAKEFKKETLNDNLKGIYILCLVFMQLNEFLLHYFNNPKNLGHQISAFLIPVTITIQIICLLSCTIVIPDIDKGSYITGLVTSSILLASALYFFITVFIPTLYKRNYKSVLLCPTGCRLKWDSADLAYDKNWFLAILFSACYAILLFLITYFIFGYEILITLICLLAFAYFLSYTGKSKNYNRIGSMWCLMTAVVICGAIIMD